MTTDTSEKTNGGEERMNWKEELSEEKGIPVDEIDNQIRDKKEQLTTEHPNRPEDKIEKLAKTQVKREISSSGDYKVIEISILGKDSVSDMVGFQKRRAKEAYEEDPDLAVAKGLTDRDGTPLWTADTWASLDETDDRIGTPLPENLNIRTAYGINKDSGKLVTITGTRKNVSKISDLDNKGTYEIRVLDRNEPGGYIEEYSMGEQSSVQTKTVEEVTDEELVSLLEELDDVRYDLSEVRDYIEETPNLNQSNRLVLTTGFVNYIDSEVNAMGNKRIVIDEAGSGENRGMTLWVPENIDIDFGQNSIVYALGGAGLGNLYGNLQVEPLQMNAFALVADPEFKEEREVYYESE